MTAIVGILNKRAAVMAADSAITVSNSKGVKVYNTATKIFCLSDEHPIGVMIFNSVEFMGTPWDLIFNLYRKEQGGKARQSVQEYAEDFIYFLKSKDYFSNEESREQYFTQELAAYYDMAKTEVSEQLQEEGEDENNIVRAKLEEFFSDITELSKEKGVCEEFKGYKESDFLKLFSEYLEDLKDVCEQDHLPTNMMDGWRHGVFEQIRSKCFMHPVTHTGLVFVGYGEKDFFPSIFPMYIGGVIDNRLRYYFDTERADNITHTNKATVAPFAQGDVMLTMMKGLAPDMYTFITDEVRKSMKEVVQQAAQRLGIRNKNKVDEVVEPIIDEIQKDFEDKIDDIIVEQYTSGIVETVESFNVEDMVNMAESLISITNLQRHITSSEESVGGPIDVAIITKSRGFQWAKHKKEEM